MDVCTDTCWSNSSSSNKSKTSEIYSHVTQELFGKTSNRNKQVFFVSPSSTSVSFTYCLKYFRQVCFHLILAVNIQLLHSKPNAIFSFFRIFPALHIFFTSLAFSFAWFVCCRNVCFNILCYKIASGGCELSVDAAYVFPTGFRFARIAGIRLFWFVVFIILLFLLCIMYDYYHHSRTKMPANGSPLCACVRVRCVSPQFTNFASHKLLLFGNLL